MSFKKPRIEYVDPDPRDINIFKEVEQYRLQHTRWERELKELPDENQIQKIDDIFEIVKGWEVVTLTNMEIFNQTKSLANKFEAFDEIRRRFIEFCWYTLKYYVTKRMRSKGYPEFDSNSQPLIVETVDSKDGLILTCTTTKGNYTIKSLRFTNKARWSFPSPDSIQCHIEYDRSYEKFETKQIMNFEDLQNLLNAKIHPDASYQTDSASALHWTALTRLIDMLENHYV